MPDDEDQVFVMDIGDMPLEDAASANTLGLNAMLLALDADAAIVLVAEDGTVVCLGCGTVVTLETAGKSYYYGEGRYAHDEGTKSHSWVADYLSFHVCPNCGSAVDDNFIKQEDKVINSPSPCCLTDESGNTCPDCGYTYEACPTGHANTQEWSYAIDGTPKHRDGTYTHSIHITSITYQCSDCGLCFTKAVDKESMENCSFNQETKACYSCGFVNTCDHANATETTYPKNYDEVVYNHVDGTYTHSRTYQAVKSTYCGTCGMSWYEDVGEVTDERHCSFRSETNTCRYCKWENTCQHENAQWHDDRTHVTGKDNGDGTHTISYDTISYLICDVCTYSNTKYGEHVDGVVEAHDFINGKCRTCDAPCPHANTSTGSSFREDLEYAPNDALTHVVTYDMVRITRCKDCWMEIGRETSAEAKSMVEKHDIGKDGRCVECGYLTVCTHESAYVRTYVDSWDYYGKDDLLVGQTELNHEFKEFGRLYCPECGYLGEVTETGNTIVLSMCTMQNPGECSICGYKRNVDEQCQHARTKTYYNHNTYGAKAIDAHFHTWLWTYYEGVECLDCGLQLSYEAITEKVEAVERHYFNYGVCVDCGTRSSARMRTRTRITSWSL